MREIKFRAWDKQFNHWLLNSDTLRELGYVRNFKLVLQNDNNRYIILNEYTGLKDKNGKEIYEGDICTGNWPYAKRCVVRWVDKRGAFMFSGVAGEGLGENGAAAYDREGYKLNSEKVAIIGNIYENPELLKAA